MAFQEADAPVFFGRDGEIQEGLDRLHNLRRYGGKALLLVLGASGCGKSSLVRAGIVPRLRRDPENWLVLDPFRPRSDPFGELADVLATTFGALGQNPPEPPTTVSELKNQLEDLRRRSGHRDATAVVVIDQFEELLVWDGSGRRAAAEQPAESAAATTVERFLAFLRETTSEADGMLLVLATLRSDFLGSFQCHPSVVGVPNDQFLVGPMEAPSYARVISGPAEVVGLELKQELTDRMVADTRTGNALPLLAFTLRELWERYGRDGDLTLTEYEHLGGLEGSVQRAADGVLAARPLIAEEEEALRRAFVRMCRINEEGQHARITARWEEMPAASISILKRFVKVRLLVSGKEKGSQKPTLEVAHEALLREWPTLRDWLKDAREELEQQQRVRRRCQELRSSSPTARQDALRSLEAMAEEDPEAIRLVEEAVIEVVGNEQYLSEERKMALRLLGMIGGEKSETALSNLLESEQLHEEADSKRLAYVLEMLTSATGTLLHLQQQGVSSGQRSQSLLVPSAMLRPDGLAESTSLLRMKLLSPPQADYGFHSALGGERGDGAQGAWFEELAPGETLTMVQIPAGSFRMGSPSDEPVRYDDEGPQHEVNLREFFLAQTPITQAQWQLVAGWEQVERELKPDPSNFKGAKLPVEQVSWHDAMEFCARLSQRTGRTYTLPSEAQWEYACRAGTTTPFAFGETITTDLANYDGSSAYGDGPKGTYRQQTTPVGTFPANAWGLHDMHGNVWEWCLDHWHANYQGAPGDGSAWLDPKAGEDEHRLLRGGSWCNGPRYCRSAFRSFHVPGDVYYGVGFRVVCLPQGPT